MQNPKKGDILFNKTTKQKIVFGKWNTDGSAACITKNDAQFITIPKSELETQWESYKDLEKKAKERRRGEGW